MRIEIICFSACGVINFEINHSFPIKPFLDIAKKSGQKCKYLKDEKKQSIFHHSSRAFNCQTFSQTREWVFKDLQRFDSGRLSWKLLIKLLWVFNESYGWSVIEPIIAI